MVMLPDTRAQMSFVPAPAIPRGLTQSRFAYQYGAGNNPPLLREAAAGYPWMRPQVVSALAGQPYQLLEQAWRPGGITGDYNTGTGMTRILDQPGMEHVIAHEAAHAWANNPASGLFRGQWDPRLLAWSLSQPLGVRAQSPEVYAYGLNAPWRIPSWVRPAYNSMIDFSQIPTRRTF